jgi:2-isopropylmalate synthase
MNGELASQTGTGDGPVDAVYHTIAALTETKSLLRAYIVKAITGGTDAQGEVSVTGPIRILLSRPRKPTSMHSIN